MNGHNRTKSYQSAGNNRISSLAVFLSRTIAWFWEFFLYCTLEEFSVFKSTIVPEQVLSNMNNGI